MLNSTGNAASFVPDFHDDVNSFAFNRRFAIDTARKTGEVCGEFAPCQSAVAALIGFGGICWNLCFGSFFLISRRSPQRPELTFRPAAAAFTSGSLGLGDIKKRIA